MYAASEAANSSKSCRQRSTLEEHSKERWPSNELWDQQKSPFTASTFVTEEQAATDVADCIFSRSEAQDARREESGARIEKREGEMRQATSETKRTRKCPDIDEQREIDGRQALKRWGRRMQKEKKEVKKKQTRRNRDRQRKG